VNTEKLLNHLLDFVNVAGKRGELIMFFKTTVKKVEKWEKKNNIVKLRQSATDNNNDVRLAALKALVNNQDDCVVKYLSESLGDEVPAIRYYSAKALISINNQESLRVLLRAVTSENIKSRIIAVKSLAEISPKKVVDEVKDLKKNTDIFSQNITDVLNDVTKIIDGLVGKIPCVRCGTMILPTTARQNDGQCMPCSRKFWRKIKAKTKIDEEDKNLLVYIISILEENWIGNIGVIWEKALFPILVSSAKNGNAIIISRLISLGIKLKPYQSLCSIDESAINSLEEVIEVIYVNSNDALKVIENIRYKKSIKEKQEKQNEERKQQAEKEKRQQEKQRLKDKRKSWTLHQYAEALSDIGTLRPGNPYFDQPGYDSTFNTTGKSEARVLGQEVYEKGGHSAMLEVAHRTVAIMGPQVQIELDYCWNGIGRWQS